MRKFVAKILPASIFNPGQARTLSPLSLAAIDVQNYIASLSRFACILFQISVKFVQVDVYATCTKELSIARGVPPTQRFAVSLPLMQTSHSLSCDLLFSFRCYGHSLVCLFCSTHTQVLALASVIGGGTMFFGIRSFAISL